MITMRSEVRVQGMSGDEFLTFMLHCTDADYQAWWPEMHLAFHTIERFPTQIGNLVYFDEYVGQTRLKFKGIVTDYAPSRRLVWQMLKGVRLPAWLKIECQPEGENLHIVHTLTAGFKGLGALFDPLIRLYLSEAFYQELDEHAQTEFPLLAELLIRRKERAHPPSGLKTDSYIS
jgi:hypothetical protein